LVVVVAFDSDDVLEPCLSALRGDLDVLVVDNASRPETRVLAEAHHATYMASLNHGFATAVNLGLTMSAGRDVLLLNPDARITPEGVSDLQEALHDPERHLAAVGPLLFGEDGMAQPPDWPLPSPLQVWADAFGLSRRLPFRRFVTGAVLLLRADAVLEVGGFDERYFLYSEEADWQRRAQDAGWDVAVVPAVSSTHIGAATSADSDVRDDHFYRSSHTYTRRWYGSVGASITRVGAVAAAVRRSTLGPDRHAGRRALDRQIRPIRTPSPARPAVAHVVVTDAFAGVERSVVDVAAEQHRRGWRVTVIGGDAAEMRRQLPPGVAHLAGTRLSSAARSLRRVGEVDVIHAHMTSAELVSALATRRAGARLVSTRHFAARRGSSPAARVLGRWLARKIDDEIAISDFVAEHVGVPTQVVRNGVAGGAAPRRRDKTIVMLQRLEPEKQTALGIEAWHLSGLGNDGWRLVIYGIGSEHASLSARVADLACTGSVELAGFTQAPRQAMRTASVLLATAPAEPFGLTVTEAMAEGTPVLAADGGAHREVLGEHGSYFSPGDAAGAARQLVGLTQLPQEARDEIGRQLRARQERLFTIERQVSDLLGVYRSAPRRMALLSLEPWDGTWRRNQHLASRLVASGAISSLIFVNPIEGGLAPRARRHTAQRNIDVVTPPLVVPRRHGGHRIAASWLRRELAQVDLLWVNDPVAGAAVIDGRPMIYDVTDDWRSMAQPAQDRRRVVAAEAKLSAAATTVVCSPWLADRWKERYGVDATVIGNGVDVESIRSARPRDLSGAEPHVMYVGTAHSSRVDVDLLCRVAEEIPGTLHLVGPDALDDANHARLDAAGAVRHGSVDSRDVPSWLVAADVLICPHLVDDFTLSLDAIKAYEYLATQAPVVATSSSGFQTITAPGLVVAGGDDFIAAVRESTRGVAPIVRPSPPDWNDRAQQFEEVLDLTARPHPRPWTPHDDGDAL
jgi:glycosyltransferase involved in cell wall biosynthesis/GT2 family glycosyltransferase